MCLSNFTPWSSCWKRGLAPLLPSTTQKLYIHSYDALLSCITYTKQCLSSLSPYSSSIEIPNYSNPLSSPLLLDLSVDTGFLQVAGFLVAPLHESKTYVASKDTSNVVIVSSQIISYVACQ
jgi:hypothetical protein